MPLAVACPRPQALRAGAIAVLLAAGVMLTAGHASGATPAAAATAVGGGHGRILYAGNSLTIRRPDGSHRTVVPHTRYWAEPRWSPDGRWIVAAHGQRATVLKPDGSKRKAISPKPPSQFVTRYATSPTWSPDSRRIAYVLQLDHKYEIRIVNRSGKLLRRLTKATKYLPEETAWSPDGKRLAFVGTVEPNSAAPAEDIFTIRVNNSDVRRLTKTPTIDEYGPAWRPDGKRIVYQHDTPVAGGVQRHLFVMRPTGAGQKSIYTAPDVDSYMETPTYSPDGRWVAFGYKGSGSAKYGVRRIRADGTGLTIISKDFGTHPSWR